MKLDTAEDVGWASTPEVVVVVVVVVVVLLLKDVIGAVEVEAAEARGTAGSEVAVVLLRATSDGFEEVATVAPPLRGLTVTEFEP